MVFRNVQALRAIAALLVVAVHMGNTNGFEARFISESPILMRPLAIVGNYGVDLFFVISGFIMTVTTWRRFGERDAPWSFLARRVARIYPPYWFVLLPVLALFLIRPDLVDSHASVPPNLLASILLLPQRSEPLLLVSWTLVFEMAFYLVFAFALTFSRRWMPLILAAWVAAIAIAALNVTPDSNAYVQFLATPLPLEFLFGIVAGSVVARGGFPHRAAVLALGVVLVGVLIVLANRGGNADAMGMWYRALLAGAGFGGVLYGLVGLEKVDGLLLPRWLDTLGDASYAMYLWHIPVLAAVGLLTIRLHAHGALAHAVLVAFAFAAVIAVALAVFRFVERPLTRALQRRLTSGSVPRAPGVRATAAAD